MTYPLSPGEPGGRHHAAATSPSWQHTGAGYGDAIPQQRGGEHHPPPGQFTGHGAEATDWWRQPPADPRYAAGQGQPGPGRPAAPPPPDQRAPYRQPDDVPGPGPAYEAPRPQGHAWEHTELDDLGWADRRYRVASTLKHVIAKHTHEAFNRFGRRDALAPHGVVLFY